MGLTVGGVVELVGPDGAIRLRLGKFGGQAPGIAHKIIWVAIRGCGHLDQLGTGKAQHVLLFLALGFGDHNHRLESHRGAHKRQTNPGIACRPFDNGTTGLQSAVRNRIPNDE